MSRVLCRGVNICICLMNMYTAYVSLRGALTTKSYLRNCGKPYLLRSPQPHPSQRFFILLKIVCNWLSWKIEKKALLSPCWKCFAKIELKIYKCNLYSILFIFTQSWYPHYSNEHVIYTQNTLFDVFREKFTSICIYTHTLWPLLLILRQLFYPTPHIRDQPWWQHTYSNRIRGEPQTAQKFQPKYYITLRAFPANWRDNPNCGF